MHNLHVIKQLHKRSDPIIIEILIKEEPRNQIIYIYIKALDFWHRPSRGDMLLSQHTRRLSFELSKMPHHLQGLTVS